MLQESAVSNRGKREAVQQKNQGGKGEAVRQKNLKYWLQGAAPTAAQKLGCPFFSLHPVYFLTKLY